MSDSEDPSDRPGRPPASGRFHAYAVDSASGPHVTVQAATVHLGRHWTMATRRSVKARAVRQLGWASATAPAAPGWRLIGGPSVVLDFAHPTTLARDVVATGSVGGALLRLGLGNLGQLVGYAEAVRSVPIEFLPMGRVMIATRITEELSIDRDDIATVHNGWRRRVPELIPTRSPPDSGPASAMFDAAPTAVAELALRAGCGWLGIRTACGSVALPAVWDPAGGRASVSRSALTAVGGELPGAVCLTLDGSDRRRPDEKVGVILRGVGSLADLDRTTASVAVVVRRISAWSGFSSGPIYGEAPNRWGDQEQSTRQQATGNGPTS